jgi:hypothetical protein
MRRLLAQDILLAGLPAKYKGSGIIGFRFHHSCASAGESHPFPLTHSRTNRRTNTSILSVFPSHYGLISVMDYKKPVFEVRLGIRGIHQSTHDPSFELYEHT